MALIKELRERTGVGFGDCKKALVEADWNMDRAVDIVRLQSGAKAAKKADRTAAEGLLGLKVDGDLAAMVEVNVETDFAARNPKFAAFVERAVTTALEDGADGLAATLEAERQALVQEIGENINVRRATRLDAEPGGTVVGYLHLDGKKGTLVAIGGSNDAQGLGQDIAMHITAMRPLVVAPEDVPADVVAKEKAIFAEQAADSGKPPQIVEKMVTGRVAKFLAESSLLEQPFVKDSSVKVGKLLKSAQATCTGFERFEVGEGIDKKQEDFAEEVRKQIG
ncbi:MAG: translation elongation factor Ts [Gammaproteobacteria bacterium]|nr:translation elongation factor Ts [Gammaproteobacteria bacterium]